MSTDGIDLLMKQTQNFQLLSIQLLRMKNIKLRLLPNKALILFYLWIISSICAVQGQPVITGMTAEVCGDSIDLLDYIVGDTMGEVRYGSTFGSYPYLISQKVKVLSDTAFYVIDSVSVSSFDTAVVIFTYPSSSFSIKPVSPLCLSDEPVELTLTDTLSDGFRGFCANGTCPSLIDINMDSELLLSLTFDSCELAEAFVIKYPTIKVDIGGGDSVTFLLDPVNHSPFSTITYSTGLIVRSDIAMAFLPTIAEIAEVIQCGNFLNTSPCPFDVETQTGSDLITYIFLTKAEGESFFTSHPVLSIEGRCLELDTTQQVFYDQQEGINLIYKNIGADIDDLQAVRATRCLSYPDPIFDPLCWGIGKHAVEFKYEDDDGCYFSEITIVEVLNSPLISGVSSYICLGDTITVSDYVDTSSMSSVITSMLWDTIYPPTQDLDQSTSLVLEENTILYFEAKTSLNLECTDTATAQLTLIDSLYISLSNGSPIAAHYCANDEPFTLTGLPVGGAFCIIPRLCPDTVYVTPIDDDKNDELIVTFEFSNASDVTSFVKKYPSFVCKTILYTNPQTIGSSATYFSGKTESEVLSEFYSESLDFLEKINCEGDDDVIFDPSEFGAGFHEVCYKLPNSGDCPDTVCVTICVIEIPEITGTDIWICEGDTVNLNDLIAEDIHAFKLTYVDTLTGSSVDSIVVPSDTTTYLITASHPTNNCTDTTLITISVNPKPDLEITLANGDTIASHYCANDAPFLLIGNQTGGRLWVMARNCPDSVKVTPIDAPKDDTLKVTFYMPDNASAAAFVSRYPSFDKNPLLYSNPKITGSLVEYSSGKTGSKVEAQHYPSVEDFLQMIHCEGDDDVIFDPSEFGAGYYDVCYKVNVGEKCTDTICVTICVIEIPEITGTDIWICEGDTVNLNDLIAEDIHAFKLTYVDTLTGSSVDSIVVSSDTTTYLITASHPTNNCTDTTLITISVNPKPDLEITLANGDTIASHYCANDAPFLLIGNQTGGRLWVMARNCPDSVKVTPIDAPKDDTLKVTFYMPDNASAAAFVSRYPSFDKNPLLYSNPKITGSLVEYSSGKTGSKVEAQHYPSVEDFLQMIHCEGDDDVIFDPSEFGAGYYDVCYKVNVGEKCTDTICVTICVIEIPEITGTDIWICEGDTVNLNDLIAEDIHAFKLTYVDTLTGSSVDSIVVPSDTTTYLITASHPTNNCTDTTLITISVNPKPDLEITLANGDTIASHYCANDAPFLLIGNQTGGRLWVMARNCPDSVKVTPIDAPKDDTLKVTFYMPDNASAAAFVSRYPSFDKNPLLYSNPKITGSLVEYSSGKTGSKVEAQHYPSVEDFLQMIHCEGDDDVLFDPSEFGAGYYDVCYKVNVGEKCTDTICVTICVIEIPEITGTDIWICEGDTVNLNDLIAEDIHAFKLTYVDTLTGSSVDSIVVSSDTTTYLITASHPTNNCTDTTLITISVNPKPDLEITLANGDTIASHYCANDAPFLLIGNQTGGRLWVMARNCPDSVKVTPIDAPKDDTLKVTFYMPDNASAAAFVSRYPSFDKNPLLYSNPKITGSLVEYSSGKTGSKVEAQHYPSVEDFLQMIHCEGDDDVIFDPSEFGAGYYDVCYKVNVGEKCTDTICVTICVIEIPEITGTDIWICEGDTVNLNDLIAEDIHAFKLTYVDTLTGSSVDSIVVPSDTTTYLITASHPTNNCTDTTLITISVNPKPDLEITLANGDTIASHYCANDAPFLLIGNQTGGRLWVMARNCPDSVKVTPIDAPKDDTLKVTFYMPDNASAAAFVSRYPSFDKNPLLYSNPKITGSLVEYSSGKTGSKVEAQHYPSVEDFLQMIHCEGDDDVLFDPSEFGAGYYDVCYKVNVGEKCTDTICVTICVIEIPEITGEDVEICVGDTVNLNDLITEDIHAFDLVYSIKETYKIVDSVVVPKETTTYLISSSHPTNSCTEKTTIKVTVHEKPELVVTLENGYEIADHYCENDDPFILKGNQTGGRLWVTARNCPDTVFVTPVDLSKDDVLTVTFCFTNSQEVNSFVIKYDSFEINNLVYKNPSITTNCVEYSSGKEESKVVSSLHPTALDFLKIINCEGDDDVLFDPWELGPGFHEVCYKVKNTCDCQDTLCVIICVLDFPEITGRDTAVCGGEMIDLNKFIIEDVSHFELVYTDLNTNEKVDQVVYPLDSTTYLVESTHLTSDCIDTTTITIITSQPEEIVKKLTKNSVCIGQDEITHLQYTFLPVDSSVIFSYEYKEGPADIYFFDIGDDPLLTPISGVTNINNFIKARPLLPEGTHTIEVTTVHLSDDRSDTICIAHRLIDFYVSDKIIVPLSEVFICAGDDYDINNIIPGLAQGVGKLYYYDDKTDLTELITSGPVISKQGIYYYDVHDKNGGCPTRYVIPLWYFDHEGGLISSVDGSKSIKQCVGLDLNIDVKEEHESKQWVICDEVGIILDVVSTSAPNKGLPLDLSTLGVGRYLVSHLSYLHKPDGLKAGHNINNLSGCFDLSNSMLVEFEELEFFVDKEEVEVCAGESSKSDRTVSLSPIGSNYIYTYELINSPYGGEFSHFFSSIPDRSLTISENAGPGIYQVRIKGHLNLYKCDRIVNFIVNDCRQNCDNLQIISITGDQTVTESMPVEFIVIATGSYLTYQWQELIYGTWVNINNATQSKFKIENVLPTDHGRIFRATVKEGTETVKRSVRKQF